MRSSSSRGTSALFYGSIFFSLLTLAGCGTSDDGTAAPPGTSPPGSSGDVPGDPPGKEPDPAKVDTSPIAFRHLLAGFDFQSGWFHPPSQRVVSVTPALTSSLARITVAKVNGLDVDVSTLAVKGKLPSGRIEAMTYSDALDRFVMIVRAYEPHRIEVVTLALGATDATFETLPQSAPTKADGYMFNALYPKGGNAVLAVRGNELVTLTIGTQATWESSAPATTFFRGNSVSVMLDAKRSQLVAYGKETYDFGTKTTTWSPTVATMPLSGPYAWNDVTMSNPPPAEAQGVASYWAAIDGGNGTPRILAIVPIKGSCGPIDCMMQSLWSAPLGGGMWTKLRDHYNPPNMYKPWVVDDAGRRVYSFGDGSLSAIAIDPASTLEPLKLVQKGDLGPSEVAAAIVLSNGSILTSDGGSFRTLVPSSPSMRWERFGKATLPSTFRYHASFTEDRTSGEVLVFGGASNNATEGTSELHVLAKDGSTLTKIEPVGAVPPARSGHAGWLSSDGKSFFVTGGSAVAATSSSALDDMWSFDRTAKTWKKIGALPKGLTGISVRRSSANELLALGYAVAGNERPLAPIVAIDETTGKARELIAKGDAPERLWSIAPFGSCFVGYESGDTVDGTVPQLWRCKRSGDDIVWEKTPLDVNDYAIGTTSLRGASNVEGTRAYFVGRNVFTAESKQ